MALSNFQFPKIPARLIKRLFGLSVLLTGILILFPYHDFQAQLSTGDNGRDFYCFQQTLNGAIPYQDYWWVYGPLMPYYYSGFLYLFGISIKTIFLGNLLLKLVAGILIYLIMAETSALWLALIAAGWFWSFSPDFSYTYNHIGAVVGVLATIHFLFQYIRNTNTKYLYYALLSIFLTGLIKVNIGTAALVASFLTLIYTQKKLNIPINRTIVFTFFSVPISWGIVYSIFLYSLPLYVIRQCLPYLAADHPIHIPITTTILAFTKTTLLNIASSPANMIFGFLVISCAILTAQYLRNKNETDKTKQTSYLLHITTLCFFISVLAHEFLLSGVAYRVFWVTPVQIILFFFIISIATQKMSLVIRILLYLTLSTIVVLNVTSKHDLIRTLKTPFQHLNYSRAQIYAANPPEWHDVIFNSVNYINRELQPGETFLALPYDPLYYFLTERASPTRQLIFFDHINIPPEQEIKIIAELEKNRVDTILLSNRMDSNVTGLGTFGKTYCPKLYKYITSEFKETAVFGNWDVPAGIFNNHAVKIYRRVKK